MEMCLSEMCYKYYHCTEVVSYVMLKLCLLFCGILEVFPNFLIIF